MCADYDTVYTSDDDVIVTSVSGPVMPIEEATPENAPAFIDTDEAAVYCAPGQEESVGAILSELEDSKVDETLEQNPEMVEDEEEWEEYADNYFNTVQSLGKAMNKKMGNPVEKGPQSL